METSESLSLQDFEHKPYLTAFSFWLSYTQKQYQENISRILFKKDQTPLEISVIYQYKNPVITRNDVVYLICAEQPYGYYTLHYLPWYLTENENFYIIKHIFLEKELKVPKYLIDSKVCPNLFKFARHLIWIHPDKGTRADDYFLIVCNTPEKILAEFDLDLNITDCPTPIETCPSYNDCLTTGAICCQFI